MSPTVASPSCWARRWPSTTHARLMASLRPCRIGPAMPKQAWVIRKLCFETNVRTMSSRLADPRLGNVSSTTGFTRPCATSKLASREFVPPMSPAKIMASSFSLTSLARPGHGPGSLCPAPALGDHDGPTIDVIRLPGDVVGISGGQKDGHSSDIFRLITPPRREGSDTPLDLLLHRHLVPFGSRVHRHHGHVGHGGARAYGIDVDVMRSEGHCGTFRHRNH